jgi:hypothetical protein
MRHFSGMPPNRQMHKKPLDKTMICRKNSKSCLGATLIELVVTILVAGIVSTLVFAFYSNVIKGYWMHTRSSESVKSMINARLKINGRISRIGNIISCRKDAIDYVNDDENNSTDSLRTICLKDSMLLDGKDTIVKGLSLIDFTVLTKTNSNSSNSNALLLWEAELKKGEWIAGAKEVVMPIPIP